MLTYMSKIIEKKSSALGLEMRNTDTYRNAVAPRVRDQLVEFPGIYN